MSKENFLHNPTVSIAYSKNSEYPDTPPFHPDNFYPEYIFNDSDDKSALNYAYTSVRNNLALLNLDIENFNSARWNPLGEIIFPGNTIIIKPNAVWDINLNKSQSIFASITHGSVLRAIIDYTYIALKGKGKIIIADAPMAHSNFENWKKITGVEEIAKYYYEKKNFVIEIFDLRKLYAPWDHKNNISPAHLRKKTSGDPAGYLEIDLAENSEFSNLSDNTCNLIYGSDYNRKHVVNHHTKGHHRYCVAKSFLEADVIISVPKLKVHSKVGATLNLKGMVGTQGDKNYIPHCRIGDPSRGGDEYPDLGIIQNLTNRYRMWLHANILSHENRIADFLYKILVIPQKAGQSLAYRTGKLRYGKEYFGNILGGSWYGNDTAWRMTLDLTKIILYADKDGKLCEKPQKRFFSIIDGIIAGEGDGPLAPTAKKCGVTISGFNPLCVDLVAVRLMGFDQNKIPMIKNGLDKKWLNFDTNLEKETIIKSNFLAFTNLLTNQLDSFNFTVPKGWRGHIEK